jgi:hypothetical protein
MARIVKVWAIDGDKFKFRYCWSTRKGGNGFGLSDEGVSYTLNTIDRHMVGIVKRVKSGTMGGGGIGLRKGS